MQFSEYLDANVTLSVTRKKLATVVLGITFEMWVDCQKFSLIDAARNLQWNVYHIFHHTLHNYIATLPCEM